MSELSARDEEVEQLRQEITLIRNSYGKRDISSFKSRRKFHTC